MMPKHKIAQEFNQLISDAHNFIQNRRSNNSDVTNGLVTESMGFTSNEVIEINQFLKNENSRNTRIS
jgi:hypothetical protein